MDWERKDEQSYQRRMCARMLSFSNGDLLALFDRSDGGGRRWAHWHTFSSLLYSRAMSRGIFLKVMLRLRRVSSETAHKSA